VAETSTTLKPRKSWQTRLRFGSNSRVHIFRIPFS